MVITSHPTMVTVPQSRPTNDTFDSFDIDFSEGEQADKPVLEEVRLWWFNGLPTDTDVTAVGWHIKAGVNPTLDETMQGMNMPRCLVQHKKPDRDGNTDPKPYWRLRQCNLIIVAQRLQSTLEMRNPSDRLGIAYAWETIRDEQGRPLLNKRGKEKRQTVLKLRAFIHELYQHGYYDWLPVTLSGFSTDSMLEALAGQYRVLECYSAIRRAQGKNPVAPFYLFSIPLGPGPMKLVGEPPDQGSIYPIVATIPATIDKAYLNKHLIPKELIERLREQLLTESIIWSIEESERMVAGRLISGDARPMIDGALSPEHVQEQPAQTGQSVATPPIVVPEDDPLVQKPQLTWITHLFCGDAPEKIQQVCQAFHVSSPEQLRISHFRQLVSQAQALQKNAQR